VIPIVLIYRKYYGWTFAWRITALMFVTIVAAALVVDGLFSAAGLIPDVRPTRSDIFGSVQLDYKLFFDILGVVIFTALFWLTMRRGETDPVCGMKIDRKKAYVSDRDGRTVYLCSEHCRREFEAGSSHEGHRAKREETAHGR
jgi:YHS domain-containing protein